MSLPYDPANPAVARDVLSSLGAAPNKILGQNFLIDPAALDRIAQVSGIQKTDSILEIGPGLGALTVRLKRDGGPVTAIEKDRAFAAFIRNKLRGDGFKLVEGDALDVKWDDLGLPETGVKLVANLPYSISKPVLRQIIEDWRPHFSTATVLVQREVADRLVGNPGSKEYGPMSIMAGLYAKVTKAFDILPEAFLPPPAVVSTVVHIEMLSEPSLALKNEDFFWKVVRAAFAQRRKTLGNTMKVIASKEKLTAAFEHLQIDPMRRGETLSIAEFAALSETLSETLEAA